MARTTTAIDQICPVEALRQEGMILLRHLPWKGTIMRKMTTLVICAAAIMAAPVGAHAAGKYLAVNALQESAPRSESAFPNVAIVALNAVPLDLQLQLGAPIAQASGDDIEVLRSS